MMPQPGQTWMDRIGAGFAVVRSVDGAMVTLEKEGAVGRMPIAALLRDCEPASQAIMLEDAVALIGRATKR